MPPSKQFLMEEYKGTFLREMFALVEEAERVTEPDLCDFVVHIPGLAQDGTQDQVIACENSATTFCRRCNQLICQAHAKVFAVETYCPNCARKARAEMLPILHGRA